MNLSILTEICYVCPSDFGLYSLGLMFVSLLAVIPNCDIISDISNGKIIMKKT